MPKHIKNVPKKVREMMKETVQRRITKRLKSLKPIKPVKRKVFKKVKKLTRTSPPKNKPKD